MSIVEEDPDALRVALPTENDSVILKLIELIGQVLNEQEATQELSLSYDAQLPYTILILCLCLQGIEAGDQERMSDSLSLLFGFVAIEVTPTHELVQEQAQVSIQLLDGAALV